MALALGSDDGLRIRDAVNCMSFHPRLPYLAFGVSSILSGSEGKQARVTTAMLKVWNIEDRKYCKIQPLQGVPTCLQFSPDGHFLAVALRVDSLDDRLLMPHSITLFNAEDAFRFVKTDYCFDKLADGSLARPGLTQHLSDITCMEFSNRAPPQKPVPVAPPRKWMSEHPLEVLAGEEKHEDGDGDGEAHAHSPAPAKDPAHRQKKKGKQGAGVSVSDPSKLGRGGGSRTFLLASGTLDGYIRLWDFYRDQTWYISSPNKPTSYVRSLFFSQDGLCLFSLAGDSVLRGYLINESDELLPHQKHPLVQERQRQRAQQRKKSRRRRDSLRVTDAWPVKGILFLLVQGKKHHGIEMTCVCEGPVNAVAMAEGRLASDGVPGGGPGAADASAKISGDSDDDSSSSDGDSDVDQMSGASAAAKQRAHRKPKKQYGRPGSRKLTDKKKAAMLGSGPKSVLPEAGFGVLANVLNKHEVEKHRGKQAEAKEKTMLRRISSIGLSMSDMLVHKSWSRNDDERKRVCVFLQAGKKLSEMGAESHAAAAAEMELDDADKRVGAWGTISDDDDDDGGALMREEGKKQDQKTYTLIVGGRRTGSRFASLYTLQVSVHVDRVLAGYDNLHGVFKWTDATPMLDRPRPNPLSRVVRCPTGPYLATASASKMRRAGSSFETVTHEVTMWAASNAEKTMIPMGTHNATVTDLAFPGPHLLRRLHAHGTVDPRAGLLASCSLDESARFWLYDLDEGLPVQLEGTGYVKASTLEPFPADHVIERPRLALKLQECPPGRGGARAGLNRAGGYAGGGGGGRRRRRDLAGGASETVVSDDTPFDVLTGMSVPARRATPAGEGGGSAAPLTDRAAAGVSSASALSFSSQSSGSVPSSSSSPATAFPLASDPQLQAAHAQHMWQQHAPTERQVKREENAHSLTLLEEALRHRRKREADDVEDEPDQKKKKLGQGTGEAGTKDGGAGERAGAAGGDKENGPKPEKLGPGKHQACSTCVVS